MPLFVHGSGGVATAGERLLYPMRPGAGPSRTYREDGARRARAGALRAPPVPAFAHLLREQGVEFDRPREDRRSVDESVLMVLSVRAGEEVLDPTLDAMIDAAVEKFKQRFGDDAASIEIAASEDHQGETHSYAAMRCVFPSPTGVRVPKACSSSLSCG